MLSRARSATWAAGRLGASLTLAVLSGCSDATPARALTDSDATSARALTDSPVPAGYPDEPLAARAPADSPLTEARAELGRRLFYDARLSRTGTVACASCHRPEHAFSDSTALSLGVEGHVGTRNAPVLINRAWASSFFWDGRASTLEQVVSQPIENPLEMNFPLADAITFIAGEVSYVSEFRAAFDGGQPSLETLQQALASFIRTLVSGNSPYDQELRGDTEGLPKAAQRGEALFFSKAGCFRCHPAGPLSNGGYFNNGSYVEGGDPGRQALTGLAGDRGKFKVPTLRNVAASAPYMHDGSLPTLRDVIEQYDRGGRGDRTTDPLIEPLSLSESDKGDLEAFLVSLTDDDFLSDPRFKP